MEAVFDRKMSRKKPTGDASSSCLGWHRIGAVASFASEALPATAHSWSRLRGESFGEDMASCCDVAVADAARVMVVDDYFT